MNSCKCMRECNCDIFQVGECDYCEDRKCEYCTKLYVKFNQGVWHQGKVYGQKDQVSNERHEEDRAEREITSQS